MKNKLKILIAEDEPRARRGLKELLMMLSDEYKIVAEASDGKSALDMLHVVKPDVVFTDLKMPYMDGISLIKAAKAAGVKTKFVIVSVCEEFHAARQAISLGVTEYLVKPIMLNEVKELMERITNEETADSLPKFDWKLKDKYPDVHPLVKKTLAYIENGYSSHISQKNLADSFGVSQEYLCYLFNKEIGQQFSKFVKSYRIEIAKGLFQGGVSRQEVSYSVGFNDPKYFGKIFHEITGMSVKQYLKQIEEKNEK